ncbi:MAG TPA: radical SAM protein [Candidatus Saccharimonadales bacterium]|nr:radical SAM protein [Candidatus Saccharimonadales bacterium]
MTPALNAPGAPASTDRLIKRTTSRCPICHAPCPAQVWRTAGETSQVLLKRTCPTHGEFSACLASDARFYWPAEGAKPSCCAGGGSCGTSSFEILSTCVALIEIVRSCNLSCPTCYADSPLGAGERVDAVPLDELKQRIQGVIDRKGGIEILQLSGGEPTLHPQLFELLDWARAHEHIDYVLLNTNGVRLAHDPEFTERLGRLFPKTGLQVYLQFDGVQAEGQQQLRGADLRETRRQAIARCGEAALPVTLAMTVTPENLGYLWPAIEFGLASPHIHGITFQPMFGSGRVQAPSTSSGQAPSTSSGQAPSTGSGQASGPAFTPAPATPPLNPADLILAAVAQSQGQLREKDFTPLPCGDPNCATIGYLIRAGGKVRAISDFLDFSRLQGFLHDKLQYTLEDLARCGCESEPLGALLKQLELRSSLAFRIMIKPFMDAWNWDDHRIQRCCTHVIRPDGKLDSFCRYYSGFGDTRAAP